MPIRPARALLLLMLPLALLFAGRTYLAQIMPFHAGAAGYDQDPAYVYLLSGLTLLEGHAPHHTDHPGTPLQVLCALVEAVQWLVYRASGTAAPSLATTIVAHAEACIEALSWVLLALNAAASYYFGRRMLQATGSVLLALCAQTAPLLFMATAPRIAYLSPEALLMFATLCLLGLLAPFLLHVPRQAGAAGPLHAAGGPDAAALRIAPWAGVLCGFGVAVKVTFAPMAGLLLLLGSRPAVSRSLQYATLAFLLCLLPIAPRVGRMIFWFGALATHTGDYGTGGWGMFALGAIPSRLADLAATFPALYVVAGLLAAVLAVRARAARPGPGPREPGRNLNLLRDPGLRTPLVLLAIIAVQTLLVTKQFRYHYLLPVLPLTVVGAIWLVQAAALRTQRAAQALQGALFGTALALSASAYAGASALLHADRLRMDASLVPIQDELKKHPDALVVGAYRCSLPACALAFGASYAPELEPQLAPALPHFLYYQIWAGTLTAYGEGNVPLQRIDGYLAAGRELLLVSPDYPQLAAFRLTQIVRTPSQSLYRITGVAGDAR